jgi:prophage DNA circulation protein
MHPGATVDDRDLLEAKYTSPSGKEFIFLWEKVSKKTELKTGIFTFPDKDGAHVQHQGGGPVSFPMTCIFSGENHKKTADDFEAALLERDTAELQHPVYGIRKVIPTGDIERENDLVSASNETHVKITFTETITDEPTKPEAVTSDELEKSFDEYSEAAAEDFSANITAENINEKLQIQSSLETEANLLNDNLSGLVSSGDISDTAQENKSANFATSFKELKSNITSMFDKAENVVQSCLNIGRIKLNMMKMPSRIIIDITEKVKGYTQLITQMTNQFKNDPYGINNIKNAFASTRLVLTGAVSSLASGSALSIAKSAANGAALASGGRAAGGAAYSSGTGVLSRETAIATAIQINNLLQTIQDFEDTKIEQNAFIDSDANTYLLLMELVHNSIKLILDVSFSLPMRRTIRLDRNRNVIELCAELYNSVDNYYLDKLITENNLNIDELEIIPMGREVTYYVESA